MARAPSAVLTPADKKAVLLDLKAKIAAKKLALKEVAAAKKGIATSVNVVNKEAALKLKELGKAVVAADKTAAAEEKELAKLVASLTAIQAPAITAARPA